MEEENESNNAALTHTYTHIHTSNSVCDRQELANRGGKLKNGKKRKEHRLIVPYFPYLIYTIIWEKKNEKKKIC